MGALQRCCDLPRNRKRTLEWQWSGSNQLGQSRALHQFQHQRSILDGIDRCNVRSEANT
jgi:hypothetical protein